MVFLVQKAILVSTFQYLRRCGRGRRECQVLWTSAWKSPEAITGVVHPEHRAHAGGFVVDGAWLNCLWLDLSRRGEGIRLQVHSHPTLAFHSATDDGYPIVHTPGFLSLVIPDFGTGEVSLQNAFLAEIGEDGCFREVAIDSRLKVS
jgi:hypothetical protein